MANAADSITAKQQINLIYTSDRDDGKRLSIKFGNHPDSIYFVTIPDWQLIPIANYANTANTAIFTLFGKQSGPDNPDMIYHRAFKNELLGLRLFQADRIFSGREMAWIPREIDYDVLVMADSEKKIGLDTINSFRFDSMISRTPRYQSYILTDWSREFKFGVAGGNFYLSGEPFYLFTTETDDHTARLYKLRAALPGLKQIAFASDTLYKLMTRLIKKTDRNDSDKKQALELFRTVSEQYNLKNSPWFASAFKRSETLSDSISQLSFINRDIEKLKPIWNEPDLAKLERLLEKGIYTWTIEKANLLLQRLYRKYDYDVYSLFYYPADLSSRSVRVNMLIQNSSEVNALNSKIFEFNPIVFSSCITTARFAAFFRYVKANYPAAWNNFLESLKQPGPKTDFTGTVETPDTEIWK